MPEEATPSPPASSESKIEESSQDSSNPPLKKKEKEPEIQEMTTLHERTIATLSYMSFFCIVPFYLKNDSKFCRFHGKQGMVLTLCFFMANIVRPIDFLLDLLFILQVVIFFYMGFATISGRWKKFPFIYDWACKFEDSLSLKTKEEEEEEMRVRPDEVSEKQSSDKPTR